MTPLLATPKPTSRLHLVSNRLPISVQRSEEGEYAFSQGTGGLVSGLRGLSKRTTFQWYGWPGLQVPAAEAPYLTKRLKDTYEAVPVYLDDELAELYYNGFASQSPSATMSWHSLITYRRYPLATFSLSSWRSLVYGGQMGGIQNGQSAFCSNSGQERSRWRSNLGSRLSLDAPPSNAPRGNWRGQICQDRLFPSHNISQLRDIPDSTGP